MSRLNLAGASLLNAHLEGASLAQAHLEHADLRHAYLEGAIIEETHFEDAHLVEADLRDVYGLAVHLERAGLALAHLERADLSSSFDVEPTHLEGADLRNTYLQGARLGDAHCEGALFRFANLTDAVLGSAYLGRADFTGATLEGTNLVGADMAQVNLIGALLDRKTILRDARFADGDGYGPIVVDVRWGDVNLGAVDVGAISKVGDERALHHKTAAHNQTLLVSLTSLKSLLISLKSPKSLLVSLKQHEQRRSEAFPIAVRANRQFATVLRRQGLSEDADRFADRAQVLQRKLLFRRMLEDWRRPWRLPGDALSWLFPWFLALIAGYGYHPERSAFWYLATIVGFTVLYMQATQGWIPFGLPAPSQLAPLPWYEALILSVSSFHGRGFFQPLESLGDPVAALAAIEAVIGLLIEISFIATFTQRFFGTR